MKKLVSFLSILTLLLVIIPLESNAAGETTTGPYRKVASNAGYSWMSTYVYLPGGSNIKYGNSTDTAYAYVGGSHGGTEVDAGFQHSPTYDNWSPFVGVNGSRPESGKTDVRFKSNQEVFMKFYVASDNKVALQVTGIDTKGVKRTITLEADASGWTKSGSGNELKRVTSIAQTGGSTNFQTGSYIKNVRWFDARIGTSSTNNSAWSGTHTKEFITFQKPYVSVSYVNQSEETVSINLN
ncbi:hypothetical protein ACQCVH_22195 [Bacillus infantis]|uniref:hypothetical protein n=1 Tax=Bacillus infantis TaxID=324767 RepID=UPI003CECD374